MVWFEIIRREFIYYYSYIWFLFNDAANISCYIA
jgi:hypothetical protein